MRRHIFQSLCCHSRRDIFFPMVSLRIFQVDIEVPCHQQFGTPGALLERGDDTLYLQGDVGGKLISHDVTPLLPCRQLEADDIGSELLDGLHCKMRRQTVKHSHSAAVSDRRVCRNDAIPSRPAAVDSVCYLCFLEDYQVHVSLGHPPQRRLQSSVTTVTDVVGAEPNRHLTSRSTPSTPTHPLPTDAFLTPALAALPFFACLPFSCSRPRSALARLPLPLLSPLPSLFSPLSYSVTFTLA